MEKRLLALASIFMLALLGGCLGSGDETETEMKEVVLNGSMNLTGTQTGLAQAQPTETDVTIDIPLDYGNVVMIQVNVTIMDSDEGTDPDKVGELALAEVEGNNSATANGGSASPGTPFTTSIKVEWDGTNYMSDRWGLSIPVTLHASPDQPPGPGIIIWNGVPDQGYTYELEIMYQYHEEDTS